MRLIDSVRGRAADSSTTASAQAQAPAPDLNKILADIRAKDKGQLAVSEEDGKFLRLLIASTGRKRALEIGGASGYSAIWMAQGLRATGGKLVSIEYDPVRARELADNIKRAGLSDVVQVVAGDAFVEIPKLQGTFDFVFLDAWKRDYKKFLRRDVSAAGQGRPVHGAQRAEQAQRDGGFPGRDPAESFSLDGHRGAVRRRNLAVCIKVGEASAVIRRRWRARLSL